MVGAKGVIFATFDHLEAMVIVEKMHATIYYDSKIEPLMGGYHGPPKLQPLHQLCPIRAQWSMNRPSQSCADNSRGGLRLLGSESAPPKL